MNKIDGIISIIMVFVTAFSFSTSSSFGALATVLTITVSFLVYEIVINAANSNPSICTVVNVTIGFVFGLSLTVIFNINSGGLSALICFLCMVYKYFCAEASSVRKSVSRNFFVITVNGLLYASMFTIILCMICHETTVLYVMLYVASFLFFFFCYFSMKSMRKKEKVTYGKGGTVKKDWNHITKRFSNYLKEAKEQVKDNVDDSVSFLDKCVWIVKQKLMPRNQSVKAKEEYIKIKAQIQEARTKLTFISDTERFTVSEEELYLKINEDIRVLSEDFRTKGSISYLEYETRLLEISNSIERLRNAIKVRKVRDREDEFLRKEGEKEKQQQDEAAKRAREARERREREREQEQREKERREREERESNKKNSEYGEDRKNQEKQTGERQKESKKTGGETVYFKGCTTQDELALRYKKLCLIYHPDSSNGDADTYMEIKEEYLRLKKRLP